MLSKIIVSLMVVLIAATSYAFDETRIHQNYQDVISRTAGMTYNPEVRALVEQFGLTIFDLTWEDTGRYKNSAVGPNISDMTIQVQNQDPLTRSFYLTCMPVIRYPNFSDKTGDVPLDKFNILTGNEKGKHVKKTSLREFLGNLREYLHDPSSWKEGHSSLLAPRDSHVLVSAQACFLPIPQEGIAEFNPVLFNYQSIEGDPAILTILVTREGTSVTVIDNKRDRFETGSAWGQRLFFNQNGERASLTGKRLSEYIRDVRIIGPDQGSADTAGLNMVLLIQIPLKQKHPLRLGYMGYDMACENSVMPAMKAAQNSGVENAVIGHGRVEGPFTEIAGLDIERDPAFPIRVTVQFYKATGNGAVSESDIRQIAEQIDMVYHKADYVGSLVVGGETHRPTEYTGDKTQPREWWQAFWRRHRENMGEEQPILPWGITD
jgi:hypothetical protein